MKLQSDIRASFERRTPTSFGVQRRIGVQMVDSTGVETTRTSNDAMHLANRMKLGSNVQLGCALVPGSLFRGETPSGSCHPERRKTRLTLGDRVVTRTCPVIPVMRATLRLLCSFGVDPEVALAISRRIFVSFDIVLAEHDDDDDTSKRHKAE